MESKYFTKLNYTLANEDTHLEYQLLQYDTSHVVCVCGSGARALPLLAKRPQQMTLVDYSKAQLYLTQMRFAALKQFQHHQYLQFLGYEDTLSPSQRQTMFEELVLSSDAKENLSYYFSTQNWEPIIYMGQYEKMLIQISKLIRLALGKHCDLMFSFQTKEDFLNYYQNEFPKIRWKTVLTLIGNSTFLNAFLYKGSHPKKNIKLSYRAYYLNLFEQIFQEDLPQKSFFLQMIFQGKIIDMSGCPLEADASLFQAMKSTLDQCHIIFLEGDLVSLIREQKIKAIDFISFSDILSYFSGDLEKNYLQWISSQLNKDAITVHRYFLRVNKELNTKNFELINGNNINLINSEKTKIYHIDLYQKINND